MAKDSEKPERSSSKLEEEISFLQKQIKDLTISKENWKSCAKHYAEKFQLAYKGYLMTQGFSENKAYQDSLDVLDRLNSCKD